MQDKKLLIVGIDPGITTGYAVLDIEGNLLHLNSSKQLDLKLLISQTIELGKPLLVGTDKAKIPNLVEAFATKLGARVVNPEEDLKVDEKRRSIENFSVNDEHQGDALASALFAYKSSKPLLDKIDFFVGKNKKQDISNRIKELVIAKRISIKGAVSIIEKKKEEDKVVEKIIVEKKLNESDFLKLYNKLKIYETEIKLIKIHNNNLKNNIGILEKQIKQAPKYKDEKLFDFRESRIRNLENAIRSKENEVQHMKYLMKRLNGVVSNIGNFYILKKLDTLGLKEFNFKNKVLNIGRNDILLVNDPNIVGRDVVELLKNRVFVIVAKKPVSKKIEDILPFVFISARNLRIDEDRYFGFVEKKHFESEKNKSDWFNKIVEDYKKEKEQLAS